MTEEHFDAVVVGSGFGGSVVTYRLAEAGLRVCLLERGKAYPPGSYPRTPKAMQGALWDPSEGGYGMFDLWSFNGLEALVASALGGGSIIYANVLLRKDENWFVNEDPHAAEHMPWPVSRADLDPHYDAVEDMMNVQRYPIEHAPYDRTPKTNAFRAAAEQLGLDWSRPPLAVTFANDNADPIPGAPIPEQRPNLHGQARTTCRLCAECDIGCNYGSKNTLDFNYLSAAQHEGADIRTLHEVRLLAPRTEGGYRIRYVRHDLEREGMPFDTRSLSLQTMTADRLILSAGTLGSTFLLMKCRSAFPALSDALGTRFCGNGDLLGFVLHARENGTHRMLDPNYGPVITSTVRMGDALDGNGATGRGFYIQDAGYPAFMSWIVESSNVFGSLRRFIRFIRYAIIARFQDDTNLSAELKRLLGGNLSAAAMPLLGMGRDRPDGVFELQANGRLNTNWALQGSKTYFDRLKRTMNDIADAMGGRFVVNPTWLMKRVITVHPLGGCPMGRDAQEGVVDAHGEVFGHPNLYVADGSILPGPVGPNPSLTIAAMADRIAERIIEDHSLS
jgi:cholesterol oxidase